MIEKITKVPFYQPLIVGTKDKITYISKNGKEYLSKETCQKADDKIIEKQILSFEQDYLYPKKWYLPKTEEQVDFLKRKYPSEDREEYYYNKKKIILNQLVGMDEKPCYRYDEDYMYEDHYCDAQTLENIKADAEKAFEQAKKKYEKCLMGIKEIEENLC